MLAVDGKAPLLIVRLASRNLALGPSFRKRVMFFLIGEGRKLVEDVLRRSVRVELQKMSDINIRK